MIDQDAVAERVFLSVCKSGSCEAQKGPKRHLLGSGAATCVSVPQGTGVVVYLARVCGHCLLPGRTEAYVKAGAEFIML